MASRFQTLEVWQLARELVKAVYRHTDCFPASERYALTDQMRRAVVSIPSNIAEGSGRQSKEDFTHFLVIASGSLLEVETQLILAEDLQYAPFAQSLKERIENLARKLNAFIAAVSAHGGQ